MSISRRESIGTTAALGATAGRLPADAPKLPTRRLGKTGACISALAFGALDLGITYIDTAERWVRLPMGTR